MSRNLPPHPNLDHLKKQAKERLQELQPQNPALKLAEAQHLLAREYGFASWPKLKVYVESLSRNDASSETVSETSSPFTGNWIANLSKSKRHPGNQFQSARLQFAVNGDTVTIIDVVVDGAGHEDTGKNTILVDGNEHPSLSGNRYALLARWRGSRILETVARKDGEIVGWGTYEVSADGTTLSISGEEQKIVLDRE